jgi:hypothetical protein
MVGPSKETHVSDEVFYELLYDNEYSHISEVYKIVFYSSPIVQKSFECVGH